MPELNLFSIPAGTSFLEVLAEAMLDGRLGAIHDPADPAAMARATLYLPTRRAARAFTAILAEKLGGRPLLLPRIVPLGDVDEAETALIGSGAWAGDRLVPDRAAAAPHAAHSARRRLGAQRQSQPSQARPVGAVAGAGDAG
ncbi:hypothetical protein BTHI11S_02194 [Bosea thiooxidans]